MTRQRHQRLEAAEKEADAERILFVDLLHGKALADRHGEGVHRKPDADEEQLEKCHGKILQTTKNQARYRT